MRPLKKVWADPVWSKVIAAAILGAIGAYFLDLWKAIAAAVVAVFRFLGDKTPVWNWLIGLVSVVAVVCALEVWLRNRNDKRRGAAVPLYTSDDFFGVTWRWRYAQGRIADLYSFCPKCGLQIYAHDMSAYSAVPRVGFLCEYCGNVAGPFDGNDRTIEDQVTRFIQRNLRERAARRTLI